MASIIRDIRKVSDAELERLVDREVNGALAEAHRRGWTVALRGTTQTWPTGEKVYIDRTIIAKWGKQSNQ